MRQVIILGSLLTVALIGSYVSATREEVDPKDADKVAMYRAAPGDLRKLTWKAEDLEVVVEKRDDAAGEYSWVTVTEQIEKRIAPAPVDTDLTDTDVPQPVVEKETKVTSFKGNDTAAKLWEGFGPLLAVRELATTATTDRSVFELDDPKATIEIEQAGGPLSLVVGGETFGKKDRYVGFGDKVFLVGADDIKPLQHAKSRLIERNLHPIPTPEIDALSVTRADGTTLGFVQKNADDKEQAYWARDTAPDTKDAVAGTWVDKVLKLRVQQFVPEADLPATLTPVLTYTVSGRGETWTVEVLHDDSPTPDYFAKASFTRALVKLTRGPAREVAEDLDAVISGEALPEDTDTNPAPIPIP